jgi:hypothetical protein
MSTIPSRRSGLKIPSTMLRVMPADFGASQARAAFATHSTVVGPRRKNLVAADARVALLGDALTGVCASVFGYPSVFAVGALSGMGVLVTAIAIISGGLGWRSQS